MTAARCLGVVLSCCAVLLSGCSSGPSVIRCNMQRYNEAVTDTENEQFLLNIVRLRYRDPPKTMAVGSVTSSFSIDAGGPYSLPNGRLPDYRDLLLPQGHITDTPTVSMTPLSGGDFHAGVAYPIPLSLIVGLATTGWDLDRLLCVMVHSMNGLENAHQLAGGGGERAPRFAEFAQVAHTLGRLQQQGRLELTTNPIPVPVADLSEPVKVVGERDPIPAAAMLQAASSHALFHYDEKTKTITLKNTVTAYDLHIDNNAWGDCQVSDLARLLQVIPGAPKYRLLPGEAGQFPQQREGQSADIVVGTRSVVSSMVYLSRGVEVPAQHYQEGLVAVPLDEHGQPFDWSQLTDGLFRVCVQKHKPKNAFVAVKYRDYWFFIPDNDLSSKSTFDLMLEMYDVQISRGLTSSPVLTLPVNAGSARGGGGG